MELPIKSVALVVLVMSTIFYFTGTAQGASNTASCSRPARARSRTW